MWVHVWSDPQKFVWNTIARLFLSELVRKYVPPKYELGKKNTTFMRRNYTFGGLRVGIPALWDHFDGIPEKFVASHSVLGTASKSSGNNFHDPVNTSFSVLVHTR